MSLDEAIDRRRMRDTFGGYDWGDPVRLFTVRPKPEFTPEQLRIAELVLEKKAA